MKFAAESVPQRASGAEASRFGEDFVILEPSGRVLRGLNPTGARVWELIDGQRSAREIADRIALEYGAVPDQALGDVLTFLSVLSDKQLIGERNLSPGGGR